MNNENHLQLLPSDSAVQIIGKFMTTIGHYWPIILALFGFTWGMYMILAWIDSAKSGELSSLSDRRLTNYGRAIRAGRSSNRRSR